MRSSLFLLVSLVLAARPASESFQVAAPGYAFSFPRDHFAHPAFQTEWWYYTGNLRASDGRRFGFELTFFRQAASPSTAPSSVWATGELYLAHFALSDIDGRSFHHTERLHRAGPGLAGISQSVGRYWNGNWQVRWIALPSDTQELIAVTDRYTLRLRLDPLKPPVLQGQDGISRKGPAPGQASHYISFTRIRAQGEIRQPNSSRAVTGSVWMDHEFFTEPPDTALVGWDWFAVQLDNDQELTLYRLREQAGKVSSFSSGSYVDRQGHLRFLSSTDFSLTPGDPWLSPHSGARYPLAWQISVPSLGLTLSARTDLPDQELWSPASLTPPYWEGAVHYRGTMQGAPVTGLGYLELTGYRRPVTLSGVAPK